MYIGTDGRLEENVKPVKGKQCRKCSSKNVYLEHDLGQWYEHCLICGFTAPLEEIKLHPEDMVRSNEKQNRG